MSEQILIFFAGLHWNNQPFHVTLFFAGQAINLIFCLVILSLILILMFRKPSKEYDHLLNFLKNNHKVNTFSFYFSASLFLWYLILKTSEYIGLGPYETATMHLYSIWNNNSELFLPHFIFPGATHIGDHFEPIAAIYSPLAWLTNSPYLIIILNTSLCLLSMFIFYRIINKLVPIPYLRLGLFLLFVFNFYSQTLFQWFFSISQLAIPIFLLVILFWIQKKWLPYYLSTLLLISVKEEAGVVLISFALCNYFIYRDKKLRFHSIVLCLIGVVAFLLSMSVINHYSHIVDSSAGSKWELLFGIKDPTSSVVKKYLLSPIWLLTKEVFLFEKFIPLFKLLISTAGLATFNIPCLIALMIANFPHQIAVGPGIEFHKYTMYYSAFIIPLLFWGTIHGLLFLSRKFSEEKYRLYLLIFLLLSTSVNLMMSPLPAEYRKANVNRYLNDWKAIFEARNLPDETLYVSQRMAYPLAFRKNLISSLHLNDKPTYALISDRDLNIEVNEWANKNMNNYRVLKNFTNALILERVAQE